MVRTTNKLVLSGPPAISFGKDNLLYIPTTSLNKEYNLYVATPTKINKTTYYQIIEEFRHQDDLLILGCDFVIYKLTLYQEGKKENKESFICRQASPEESEEIKNVFFMFMQNMMVELNSKFGHQLRY